MQVSKKIVLRFPPKLVEQPLIYRLVKEFNLQFNILKASVTPKEEGLLVMEMTGERKDYDKGVRYLVESGVSVQSLSQDITRDEARCTHCGACVTLCPSAAFVVEPKSRQVNFVDSKCIACELCIKACPVRAMKLRM